MVPVGCWKITLIYVFYIYKSLTKPIVPNILSLNDLETKAMEMETTRNDPGSLGTVPDWWFGWNTTTVSSQRMGTNSQKLFNLERIYLTKKTWHVEAGFGNSFLLDTNLNQIVKLASVPHFEECTLRCFCKTMMFIANMSELNFARERRHNSTPLRCNVKKNMYPTNSLGIGTKPEHASHCMSVHRTFLLTSLPLLRYLRRKSYSQLPTSLIVHANKQTNKRESNILGGKSRCFPLHFRPKSHKCKRQDNTYRFVCLCV